MPNQLSQEEQLAYQALVKRKRACEKNAQFIENEIFALFNEQHSERDDIVLQTQFLRDIYYYGVEPDKHARQFAQGLDKRSLESWNQFKRLYAMIRQYDDGKEIFDSYFGSEGLTITSLADNGEKTELTELLNVVKDIDAYQLDLNQVTEVITLYNDDTRRIGVLLEAEKVDGIIARRSKETHYLDHSEIGDFV
jgi:hypothetical protein